MIFMIEDMVEMWLPDGMSIYVSQKELNNLGHDAVIQKYHII